LSPATTLAGEVVTTSFDVAAGATVTVACPDFVDAVPLMVRAPEPVQRKAVTVVSLVMLAVACASHPLGIVNVIVPEYTTTF